MACVVVKDCKAATDIKQSGFDLSWYAGRKWPGPGKYISGGTAIRVRPRAIGGEQPTTGLQYRASNSGWTGEGEPAWPEDSTPVQDGSIEWVGESVGIDSLYKTITADADVTWDSDSPVQVANPVLVKTGGQLLIAAHHSGGSTGKKASSWADVVFSDGTKKRFEIQWKIT